MVSEVRLSDVEMLVKTGSKVIDVRSAKEVAREPNPLATLHLAWKEGHPLVKNPRFDIGLKAIANTDDDIVFVCQSGQRALAAATSAAAKGYANVSFVAAGGNDPEQSTNHRLCR